MKRPEPCSYIAGFTLVEVLVTLVVLALLLVVGLPSLRDAIALNAVQSHIKSLNGALSAARSEAISRGIDVGVCSSSTQTSCSGSNDWSSGWIVFVDDGAGTGTKDDATRNGSEEIIQVYKYDGSNAVVVNASSGTGISKLRFTSRGFALDSTGAPLTATFRICDSDKNVSYARAVLLEQTGRAMRSFDLYDSGGSASPDGIYEDVNSTNLTCP